ncbi:MAG: hypothetical protein AB7I18_13280 [Candidatus Berkiella sp.]
MPALVALQQSKERDIEQRLSQLVGTFVDATGKQQSYFDTFNHDLELINQLLAHPPSETACYQRAYQYQEDYNQAMEIAKTRWEKGNKEFDVGKVLVKDLATRKKQYQEAMDALQAFEQKQKDIESFSDYKDPKNSTKPGMPWSQLHNLALEQDTLDLNDIPNRLRAIATKLDTQDKGERAQLLDEITAMHTFDKKEDYQKWLLERASLLDKKDNKKRVLMLKELFPFFRGRVERLKQLNVAWQAQDRLVLASTDDLIKIKNEIDNFVALMDYIEKALPVNGSAVDRAIKKQLDANRDVIKQYRQQIEAAAIWRIKGAAQYGNLRLDDALFVLRREFSQNVFQFDEPEVLRRFTDIASMPIDTISYGCRFNNFAELYKLLQRSNNTKVKQQWLNSRWVTNRDKRNLIPVTVQGNAIIPTILLPYVPAKPSYFPPSGWIRYWFFRTSELLNGFWGWVRKIWVGTSNEVVTLINEAYRHVDSFEKSAREKRAEGHGINLMFIGQSPSFLDALEIAELIKAEKARATQMVTKGVLGFVLRLLPFFKTGMTSDFSQSWLKELERAEAAIKEKAQSIAKYIMDDFEALLLDSIEKKSFIMPADLMSNIEKFIELYASKEDLKRLQQILSPIYVIKKFNFLLPPNENELFRHINDENVTAFLRYAEKYWSGEEVVAVKLVVGIITRDNVPKNAAEDIAIFEKIKCLLPEKDQAKSFKELMERLAKDFIFTTGDDGNEDSYRFLERFAPDAARTWSAHRSDNMDEKFIFLNNLLTVAPGAEKDLTGADVQEIGTTQFKLQNYERYIKDIQLAENGQSQRMKLLREQAKRYVDQYSGDNLQYANLIFTLGKVPDDPFVTAYCEKRFAWLIEQDNENEDIIVEDNDEQFIANVKRYPTIIQRLVVLIDERTDGADDQLAEWVLSFNEATLTATYFARRIQKSLADNQLREILKDGDFYEQLLANPLFSQKVYDVLGQQLARYAQNENWEALCDEAFFRVIEKIGTLQNKEAYRLLRIKRLLEQNNSSITEEYITKLAEHMGASNLDKLVTLPQSKRLLVEIVAAHMAKLTRDKEWQGHAQYFIEFFIPKENKALRNDIHLKWLSEFIKNPEKFVGETFIERATLDGKFHYQNRQIPNDSTSLTEFYGETNIPKVRELVMARLDSFNEDLSDDVIQLINGYFRDPVFNLHKDWPLYRKKRDLFQQAQKTIHCLKNGIVVDGMGQLENFYVQMIGSQALATVEAGDFHEEIAQYQQELFTQMLDAVRDAAKELFITVRVLENGTEGINVDDLASERQHRTFMDMLNKATLPLAFKNEMQEIYRDRVSCISRVNAFVANLNFEKMHLISFDLGDLSLFSKVLSKRAKRYLRIEVNALRDYLPAEDPLAKALSTWCRVLRGNYPIAGSNVADLAELSEYSATIKNYPKLAEDMATRLMTALEAHEELTYFPLFKESRLAYQSMQYLKKDSQRRLFATLKAKIEWLLLQANPAEAQFLRVDWLYHAKLLEGMLQNNSVEQAANETRTAVNLWVKDSLTDAQKLLSELTDELDSRLQSKKAEKQTVDLTVKKDKQMSLLEKEQQLLRLGLFIRSFGDASQKDKLDQLLSDVTRRQHRAMMKGASGQLVEHSLDFAEKLISTAGSDSQREQCAQLATKWNLYRMKPQAALLQSVRFDAVNDALPGYIEAFDKGIYAYFVKKHHLPENFHEIMVAKIKEWDLADDLLEPERILKKHPISAFLDILTPLAAKATHGFFYSKPSESDARKLFIGLCLSIQAHQLVKLWQDRKALVSPADISASLSTLVNQLKKKYDIGWGEFNKGLFKAIAKDTDYFASWSAVEVPEMQADRGLGKKVVAKK